MIGSKHNSFEVTKDNHISIAGVEYDVTDNKILSQKNITSFIGISSKTVCNKFKTDPKSLF